MTGTPIFRPSVHVCAIFSAQLALAMLIPMLVDAVDSDPDWQIFALSAAIIGFLSVSAMIATRGTPPPFTIRYAFLLAVMLWVSTAAAGALPLYLSGQNLSFTDAMFEAMSGITTTGSTVMVYLDFAPRGILIWRSMLQWIGGIGIVAMGLLMLPFLRVGGMQFFRIESSDRSEKPFPHFAQFTTALLVIYVVLTLICTLAYSIAGMSGFDAVNHAMTTLSTGGYSTHDLSMGYFNSPAILWIATVFMLLGALPFSLYVRAVFTGRLIGARDPQILIFLAIIVLTVLTLTVWLTAVDGLPFLDTFTHAAFNIVSVITTAGYASADYSMWGEISIAMFFMLTVCGGCAGSTSGGLKIYRLIVMFELLRTGIIRLIYPHGVLLMRYGNRHLDPEILHSVTVFLTAFLFTLVTLTMGLAFTGLDLVTALTGALTALSNVGPGLGELIGPAGNFSTLSDAAKWMLTAGMLMGRLEIMAVLVLFAPAFWRG